MSNHTYPLYTVLGDYIRAVLGVGVSSVPLFVFSSKPIITYVFWGLIVIFSLYGLRTFMRHCSHYEATNDGLLVTGLLRRGFTWSQLSKLRLKYFSTRRDKSGGWMQLEMTGNGQRIAVNSAISGFPDMLARAAEAAQANGIELDEASLANLASINTPVDEQIDDRP